MSDATPGATRSPEPPPFEPPSPVALVVLAAWLALFALAPPAHNAFWGVNGLRSLAPLPAALLTAAAAVAAVLALRAPRAAWARVLASVALAAIVAFPMREVLHHLGDTATRQGAIVNFVSGTYAQPLAGWARQLHAQPLDLVVNLLLPSRLYASSGSMALAVSVASLLLALGAFAAAWSLASRLDGGRGTAWGLWLALLAWGGMQAFAGYAEAAGIVIATLLACWAAALAPLGSRGAAARLAFAWLVAYLSHRTGLLLLPVLALRLFGPPLPGDQPRVRREAALALGAAAAAAAALSLGGASGQLSADVREFLRWPEAEALASVPTDLANLLLLLAPLSLAAPVLAGRDGIAAFARDPRARLVVLAALLYAPLAFPLPVAASGLGIHRDWDLAVGFGLSLTLAGVLLLAQLPAARLRGALVAVLPVLVLGAGGWVAAHADKAASLRRVEALANGSPPLGVGQRSAVFQFYGNRAMDLGNARLGAKLLQSSWEMVPAPSRGTHAIISWLMANEPDSARHLLGRMRARGPYTPQVQATLDTLEAQIEVIAAGQARR